MPLLKEGGNLNNQPKLNVGMGVFDEIKESVPGKGKSEDSGMDSSGLDDSFSNDNSDFGGSQNSLDSGRSGERLDPPSGRGNRQNNNQNQNRRQNRQNNRGSRSNQAQNSQHPNAQTGRPQRGESSPQLSSQTEQKMENAGMDFESQGRGRNQSSRRGQRAQQGFSNESVSGQRSDFDELKAQNEQIIELLKRINQSLQGRR